MWNDRVLRGNSSLSLYKFKWMLKIIKRLKRIQALEINFSSAKICLNYICYHLVKALRGLKNLEYLSITIH